MLRNGQRLSARMPDHKVMGPPAAGDIERQRLRGREPKACVSLGAGDRPALTEQSVGQGELRLVGLWIIRGDRERIDREISHSVHTGISYLLSR